MAKILREYLGLQYDKALVKEAKENNQPIVVKALLQRADVMNQNKRIYPVEILQREVENYKKAIAEGRATGELDHPDCECEGTKILTKDGWKDFRDISDNEYVYTLNTETKDIELQRITRKVAEHYSGRMISVKGRNIDALVTPNHRFWLVDRHGQGSFVTAQTILENREKYNKHYIPKLGAKGIYLDDRFLSVKYEDYEGMVYCISVPNETYYAMDPQGKTRWSGNSSVVSLENVSHVIRDIWWEGNEVFGKVEILNTPKGKIAQSLMESGILLGISSRGVGEVNQNEEGADVVDESFMLIAFDLVSEPSTHEAWLMREGKSVDFGDIRKMIPKVDRINRIANQILKGE